MICSHVYVQHLVMSQNLRPRVKLQKDVDSQNPGTLDIPDTLSHSWLMDEYSPKYIQNMVLVGVDPSPYGGFHKWGIPKSPWVSILNI